MSKAKKITISIFVVIAVLNACIVFTGHSYLYKGIYNTYLQGRTGPDIDEYRIFENRIVESGNYQALPISKHYNKHKLSNKLMREIIAYKTVAYLVIEDDSILYEKYWDDYDLKTNSNSFSMAKTICSILVGIAIKDGLIRDVDQAVGEFIPEFKKGLRSKITIRHLLTMSSGIGFDESYSGPFSFPAKAYYGSNLWKLVMQYEPKSSPGITFDYQSGNTQILGFVLERATGKTLSEYASEKLWKPLGAHYPAYWSLDNKNGHEKAFCCFNSNARDFARLGLLYLKKGNWDGQQIVSKEYVRESVSVTDLLEKDGSHTTRYGFSWWLYNYNGMKVFYARGILGQYIFMIPELNTVIVRLGHERAQNFRSNPPADVLTWLGVSMEILQK